MGKQYTEITIRHINDFFFFLNGFTFYFERVFTTTLWESERKKFLRGGGEGRDCYDFSLPERPFQMNLQLLDGETFPSSYSS